ncbi:poly-gamma-glutamate capsule biosynthesis protein CapA/YwtB (metallophosphatase superfamily) [Streptomyces aurantiacus]|uniref:CapA family protein n=1 Tax=Streptomyces aurantiacus TaxID=47760 RepID=UPI002790D7CF|nr:CapA family protein [Streptomyces aurantiacus]MDQ0771699.1 poly-gamma-glutamate capsule biosynthesis protein CapA/YwtB (metallophosphatase superfamily) [Streptomyces aurantiacus]
MDLTIVGDVVVSGLPRRRTVEPARPGESAFGLLRGGDLTIGNLEVPLTESGERAEKLVAMRAPASGAAELAELGFDLVSLAMNHAMDYGADGMRDTVRALDAAGVLHAGFGESVTEATGPRVVSVGERTLAFFSFCSALPLGYNATADRAGIGAIRVRQNFEFDSGFLDETPGTPPFVHSTAHEPDVRAAETLIREAKERNDVVVVALHWGVPFCYLPAAQGPLAQYQQPLARRLVDAGADLIIGSHPHCLHPVEFYGNGLILYSTGNFVFDWCDGWSPDSMVAREDAHPAAPYHPALLRGPWYESAVFRVRLGEADGPELRVEPIELDSDSQPVMPRPEVARSILARFAKESRELDPSVVVDADGSVRAG